MLFLTGFWLFLLENRLQIEYISQQACSHRTDRIIWLSPSTGQAQSNVSCRGSFFRSFIPKFLYFGPVFSQKWFKSHVKRSREAVCVCVCEAFRHAGRAVVNFCVFVWVGGDARRAARARARAETRMDRSARALAHSARGWWRSRSAGTATELTSLKCNLRVSLLTSAAKLREKCSNDNKKVSGKWGSCVQASASAWWPEKFRTSVHSASKE